MEYKNIRKIWKKYTEGWFGNVVYILLGFLVAYSINFGLGAAFNTQTPVVSVVSESMEHIPDNGAVCGKIVKDYKTEDYWSVCGSWYESAGISKSMFDEFPFPDGFNKGDILFVANTENANIGDVIVFDVPGVKYPIIHRVVSVDGENFQTKGDHNSVPDNWKVSEGNIHGKAVLLVPYLGWVKVGLMELFSLI